jgi:hypothetical protein
MKTKKIIVKKVSKKDETLVKEPEKKEGDVKKITLQKINGAIVKPVPKLKKEEKPFLGSDMFENMYSNIGIIAPRNSGKSSLLYNILEKSADADTNVVAFCSSLNQDQIWIQIQNMCRKKGISFQGYESMKEDGVDLITCLTKYLQRLARDGIFEDERDVPENEKDYEDSFGNTKKQPYEDSYISESRDEYDYDDYEDDGYEDGRFKGGRGHDYDYHDEFEHKEPVKKNKNEVDFHFKIHSNSSRMKKKEYKTPFGIVIFDDNSRELRSPSLMTFLKACRHARCACIFLSQSVNDLAPSSLNQLDYLITFKGIPEPKIIHIHTQLSLTLPFDKFQKIYHNATNEKYNFLLVDKNNHIFRKNFNMKYNLYES